MKKFVGLFILLAFSSCSSNEGTKESNKVDSLDTNVQLSDEQKAGIAKIVYSVPSPMQVAALLEKSGASYEAGLLNPTSKASSYQTTSQASLNLGVYATDMAYANVFKKYVETIKYFASIQKLGDKIGVGSIFSGELLSRLEKNQNHQDSMMAITTESFLSCNQYLSAKSRDAMATTILVGGFVEGLYLSVSIWKTSKTNEIATAIAEQKPVIQQIMDLIQKTKAEENLGDVYKELQNLKVLFDEIQIQYSPGDTHVNKEKKLVTVKNSAKAIFKNDTLDKIHEQVLKIRQLII